MFLSRLQNKSMTFSPALSMTSKSSTFDFPGSQLVRVSYNKDCFTNGMGGGVMMEEKKNTRTVLRLDFDLKDICVV